MASNASPKKSSPLSFTSARTSPFKRPDSPVARSPSTIRAADTPPKLPGSLSPSMDITKPIPNPHRSTTMPQSASQPRSWTAVAGGHGDPLSKLNPAQLHDMRESFQVLDRDDNGQVTQDDVQHMLAELGQDSSPNVLKTFFGSGPQTLNMSTYLHMLSSLLVPLSAPDELAAAFAAFDVDDSGQVDVGELREALLQKTSDVAEASLSEQGVDAVLAEFSSRRAFGRNIANEAGRRGDVFRYNDFIAGITGSGKAAQQQQAQVVG